MKGAVAALAVFFALILVPASFAAVCPQADVLDTFATGSLFEPLSLAVDSNGRLYAVDQRNDSIFIFNYSGQLVSTKRIDEPTAIGIDSDDNIYVGRAVGESGNFQGEVIVYDSAFNEQFRLGSGFGEFDYPKAIAVSDDRVYVADSKRNRVRFYNKADGSYVTGTGIINNFGGYGTGQANLVNPSALAIHPSTGNVFIVDSALRYNASVAIWYKGFGIREFTSDGGFVSKFGANAVDSNGDGIYEEQAGYLTGGAGIVIDNAGRLLVADASLGLLHTFEFDAALNSWKPLCLNRYSSYADAIPGDMAYATLDGRLFISTPGSVIELGEGEDYTKLILEPEEMLFESRACGAQPAAQTLNIKNIGPGTLDWSLAQSTGWMTVSGSSGQIVGQGADSVTVSVDNTGMPKGTSSGTITVTAPGAFASADINVNILLPTVLNVSPASFIFNIEPGQAALPQNLAIQIVGGGDWSASADVSWLGVAPSAGTTTGYAMATVSADLSGLDGGSYSGNITVTAPCADGSPVTLPAVLTYDKGGTINVTTNLDEASFTVSGPAVYSGSGKSFAVDNVPPGTYSVEFDKVDGFKTPEAAPLTVAPDEVIEFSGDYIDLRKRGEILTSMGYSDRSQPNEVRVYDGSGTLLSNVPINEFWENATPTAGDIDGDGVAELIIAHDMGVISVLNADGTPIPGLELMPFGDRAYLDVKTGDLDGDGADEIIVSSLNWSENGAAVRVFTYSAGAIVDTGIYFLAYSGEDYYWSKKNDRRGARVGIGDVDGDGIPEILTIQGGGFSRHYAYVRIFSVDTSGGPGLWGIAATGGFSINETESYYSDVDAGDIDGDGVAEIVVSIAPESKSSAQPVRVVAFESSGAQIIELTVLSERGVDVSIGDLDYDGEEEIIVGSGAFREGKSSKIWVFGADGSIKAEFSAFDSNVKGVRSAVGEFIDN